MSEPKVFTYEVSGIPAVLLVASIITTFLLGIGTTIKLIYNLFV